MNLSPETIMRKIENYFKKEKWTKPLLLFEAGLILFGGGRR
jgi:hypothetical protein